MNHNLSDERINQLNKWMMSISTISGGFKSLVDENDPLTHWDSQYYNVIKYNDGTEKIQYSEPSKPSIMLHEIDDYLQTWGLSLKSVNTDFCRQGMTYTGISYLKIDFNSFHKDMVKFDDHNWFTYTKERFQHLIYEKFLNEAKKDNNTALAREIKLRNLLA